MHIIEFQCINNSLIFACKLFELKVPHGVSKTILRISCYSKFKVLHMLLICAVDYPATFYNVLYNTYYYCFLVLKAYYAMV